MKKKIASIILCVAVTVALNINLCCVEGLETIDEMKNYLDSVNTTVEQSEMPDLKINAKSAVLMEASTGTILYQSGQDDEYPPASVTKVATLLLIMEAIDNGTISLTDEVTASSRAASMGGTQIYLEAGEIMTVDELIKAVAVPSANDAAVALAEYVAGSEEAFVSKMNERAKELGANHTNFKNCTGLFDDEEHFTSAYDIAVFTKELLKHPKIFDYSTIWMDTLRNGTFGLANTNKMLRTYTGMNGMKTGYTKLSGYCFSGTAERDGMTLIATVMGAPSSTDRFDATAAMLDYGFATYSVATASPETQNPVPVIKGKKENVELEVKGGLSILVKKGQQKNITTELSISDKIKAPVKKGTEVGILTYKLGDKTVATCPILAAETVERANFGDYISRLFKKIML